mmetsp:Transcript_10863/g.34427  ORF Transcript_10863/g.34427 Transcript_10863/m.34427 type:complete len:525 (-) Transcript_10863:41-1615(-)
MPSDVLHSRGDDEKALDWAEAYYWPAEGDTIASHAEDAEEGPALKRQGLRELQEDFLARQRALDMVAGSGRALAHVEERFRRDPDVVLLALGLCAEALHFAHTDLSSDRDFAIEAVQWNWRVLHFLPASLRGDRAVVRAAVRQNSDALQFAADVLGDDASLVAESRAGALAGLSCCEDESLRLVGPCNRRRTTDSRLRFRRVRCPNRGAVRHRLLAHLDTGRLSFQVVSCIWQSAVRIFPIKGGDAVHFRLVRGDPSAITAAIGGEEDGEQDHFYIEEDPGTVVSLYVELSSDHFAAGQKLPGWAAAPPRAAAAATACSQRRGAARKSAAKRRAVVWYCREEDDLSVPGGIVALAEPPDTACCKSSSSAGVKRRGARAVEPEVLADAELRDDCQKLVSQAQALSRRAFPNQFTEQDLAGQAHLTLLADSWREELFGYCLYRILEQEQLLEVEQVAVSEDRRGRGLGRDLMHWAMARTKSAGCTSLRLNSRNRAIGFYVQLGFAVLPDATSPGCRAMELRLPPSG